MRNHALTPTQQTRPIGIDSAVGQIDLIGEFGEVAQSWRIRSPRCTLGSSAECSVQLIAPDVAPLHATLIFGKKHTLLRSSGPTLISNRHVREWLIDQPTEITVGQSRLIVHPSLGGMATVVHAERLIEQASRLCKNPVPVVSPPELQVPNGRVKAVQTPDFLSATVPPGETASLPVDASRLDSIEELLRALQLSLADLHSSMGTESKLSNESIVESVSQEIDEFGKRLFTNLNDQLSKESGTQQTMISELANQFSSRFGSIDEQLHRFGDATVKQNLTLNDMLAQATLDHQQIESRFQEVISHRNELIEAVHVLRSEIALAYETQSKQAFSEQVHYNNDYADAPPLYIDHGAGLNPELAEHGYPDQHEAACDFEETKSQHSINAVTDDQLASSLEQAQIQIQELNTQLRSIEIERDSAQQRVTSLADSWSNEQVRDDESPVIESVLDRSQDTYPANDANPLFANEENAYETEYPREVYDTSESVAPEREPIGDRTLPTWFKQDEPTGDSRIEASILIPNIREYSDDVYGNNAEYSSEGIENSDQEQDFSTTSEAELDSMSERLQRMLSDAEDRRGPSKPVSELRTSGSWSQKFNSQPKMRPEVSTLSETRLGQATENVSGDTGFGVAAKGHSLSGALRDLYQQPIESLEPEPSLAEDSYMDAKATVENRLAAFVGSKEVPFVGSAEPQTLHDQIPERDERFVLTEMDAEPAPRPAEQTAEGEDESIEEYMQRLLNRVRGGSDEVKAKATPTNPEKATTAPSSLQTATKIRSRVAASMGLEMDAPETAPKVEKLSEELFLPRQQAPEQRNDLHALRELANTNARRAINRSDIRRMSAAFVVKTSITGVAVTSAVALFLFNGLQLNAIFLGMVSAMIVAVLWGYDCITHFQSIRSGNGMNQATAAETAAGQSIRLSSSGDSGWRPTEA